jgi:hypothetical protein
MKSEQATIQKRVDEILDLRLLGALFDNIRHHAEEQKWGISTRQLRRYIAQADKRIAAALDRDRGRLLAHHFAARRALYARAVAVSDYATAARILKDEAELLGMYPPKRTELTGADGKPLEVRMTDDERAAAIAALYARLGNRNAGPAANGHTERPRPPLGPPGSLDGGRGDDPGPMANFLAPFDE